MENFKNSYVIKYFKIQYIKVKFVMDKLYNNKWI